jgi:hypothetical protein
LRNESASILPARLLTYCVRARPNQTKSQYVSRPEKGPKPHLRPNQRTLSMSSKSMSGAMNSLRLRMSAPAARKM